jgi:hypothetical protein
LAAIDRPMIPNPRKATRIEIFPSRNGFASPIRYDHESNGQETHGVSYTGNVANRRIVTENDPNRCVRGGPLGIQFAGTCRIILASGAHLGAAGRSDA